MALPTGDDQTIIWRLVVESQKAIQDVQKFREQVDALKQYLKQVSAETGASFDSVSKSLGLSLKKGVDEAKVGLKSLEADLKRVRQESTGKDVAGNIISPAKVAEAKAALATIPPEIDKQQIALAKANAAYTTYKNTATLALKEVKQEATTAAQATGGVGTQVGTATKSVSGFAAALGGVNQIARIFFGVTLASLAIQALRAIVGWFSNATQSALDFNKAIFQLEAGVRVLRRTGIDVTTEEILANLDKINASVGNLFSQLELIKGAAAFTNLIRDLGLTKDQIFNLQEAVVKLAVVNGRAMDDVQRTVALALSSGYTEGLQRLGISINRLTIAEEANRIGFKGGYTALSEQARSEATYNLVIQKTAKYADDLSEAQKRLFGELQSNQAQLENTKVAIGEGLLPFQLLWNKALLALVQLIPKIFPFLQGLVGIGINISALKAVPAVWEESAKSADNFIGRLKVIWNFYKELSDAFKNQKPIEPIMAKFGGFGGAEVPLGEAGTSDAQEKLMSSLEDFENGVADLAKDSAEKQKKLAEDLQNDLADIAQKGIEKREDIWQKYWDDLAKIDREGAQREAELLRNYQNKIKDIDIKLGFNLQEADVKFDFDVAETTRKLNEDIAKANEEYRQREAERERKYNEDLLRLKEDYLVDLEDALSNRDAKAVLRARKDLILAKDRAARENEFDKIKNKEGLEEDIRDAQLRREARIRELQFELEQRRAELARQAQYDRELAWANYQQDVADLKLSIQQKKAERAIDRDEALRDQLIDEQRDVLRRKAKYEAELKELEAFNKAKLELIGKNLAQQAELMGLGSDAVMDVIKAYFGEGGVAEQVFASYTAAVEVYVERLKALLAGFSASISGVDVSKFELPGTTKPKGYAKGGGAVATQPTTVTFGEVPELALFAPLNQLDKLSGLFDNVSGDKGKLGISIALSPGLEAKIVEQSMDKIANVMFEVQRQ